MDDHLQIERMIIDSASASNELQQGIYKKVQELSSQQIFYSHLVLLFTDNTKTEEFRYRAGIILKSALKQGYIQHFPQLSLDQLQQLLINSFESASSSLVKISTLILSTLITQVGIKNCSLTIQFLIEALNGFNRQTLKLAVECLSKMIEDLKYNNENITFYDSNQGIKIMDSLILKFIEIIQTTKVKGKNFILFFKDEDSILASAFNFLNFNVFFMPPQLSQSCQVYQNNLLLGLIHQNHEIRLKAIQGFQALIETKRDYMNNHIAEAVKLIVQMVYDADKEVQKNAMIFLSDFMRIDDEEFLWQYELIKSSLNQFIPKTLESLQLTQIDMMNIMPSMENDYKPKESIVGINKYQKKNYFSDEDENDPAAQGEFTLRKISSLLLEKISDIFPQESFSLLSPLLEQMIQSQNWKLQEAAFLCFGTCAQALEQLLIPYMHNLVNCLFGAVIHSQQFYLRTTAVWTLGQFTHWIQSIASTEKEYIEKYLDLLLRCLDDQEKVVQESACTALNKLAQEAPNIIDSYIQQILNVYIKALDKNDSAISIFVYGSLSSVAENSQNIKNELYATPLLTKLTQKLQIYRQDDQNICALLECLSLLFDKFQEFSVPFAPVIFQKIWFCFQNYVSSLQVNAKNIYQIKQIFMRSIDLLSNMTYVLKDRMQQVVSGVNFIQTILFSLNDPDSDLKQYSISFIGEIVKSCPLLVQNEIQQIIQILSKNVYDIENDPLKTYIALTNNSIWALAEIAQQFPQTLIPFQEELLQKVIHLLLTQKLHRHIAQNFAIALTRFSALNLDTSSMHLPQFMKKLCLALADTKSEAMQDYKNESFKVLFQLIYKNPTGAISQMNYIIYSFGQFQNPTQENSSTFIDLVTNYKGTMSDLEWERNLNGSAYPQGFRQNLKNKYNL